jgi:hypothetical protein
MRSHRVSSCLVAVLVLSSAGGSALDAQRSSAEDAVMQFQRAADSYAFAHRRADRRGPREAPAVEGTLFSPAVTAVFHERIAAALRKPGCVLPKGSARDFEVPRVNVSSLATAPLPSCVLAALPRLPEELEYRVSGVVLVLADAHLKVVVDVLHGAFPQPDN